MAVGRPKSKPTEQEKYSVGKAFYDFSKEAANYGAIAAGGIVGAGLSPLVGLNPINGGALGVGLTAGLLGKSEISGAAAAFALPGVFRNLAESYNNALAEKELRSTGLQHIPSLYDDNYSMLSSSTSQPPMFPMELDYISNPLKRPLEESTISTISKKPKLQKYNHEQVKLSGPKQNDILKVLKKTKIKKSLAKK